MATHLLNLNINDKIDKYEIRRFIKQGKAKFAKVYETKPAAALKLFVVEKWEGRHKIALNKFKDESSLLKALNSAEHVVDLVDEYKDVAVHNETEVEAHYYVMELMDSDLEHHIIDTNPDLKMRIDYVLQVAKGLQECHDQNIYHKDLYTPNVLVKQVESAVVCKIGDFGSARKHPLKDSTYLFSAGNPDYASPEYSVGLLSGSDVKGKDLAKTDVFSYGFLFFEVLTNFRQEKLSAALSAVPGLAHSQGMFQSTIKPSERREFLQKTIMPLLKQTQIEEIAVSDIIESQELADRLNAIMHQLLALDAADRPDSFNDIIDKLNALKV